MPLLTGRMCVSSHVHSGPQWSVTEVTHGPQVQQSHHATFLFCDVSVVLDQTFTQRMTYNVIIMSGAPW